MNFAILLLTALSLYGQTQAILLSQKIVAAGTSINTTPVQHVKGTHNVFAVAFGSNTAAACLITVAVLNDGSGNAASAVVDTQLNTYTKIDAALNVNDGAELWYAQNCAGGADTVTVTLVGNGYVMIQEWSGASTTAALDSSAKAQASSTTVGPVATTYGSQLLLLATNDSGEGTACSGYTIIDQGVFNTYNTIQSVASGAAGNYTASSCPNNSPARVLAAFK